MSLIPHDRFKQLSKEIDRFFNDLPSILGSKQFGGMKVDLLETDREVVAICDIPGLTKREDVKIQVEPHVLTINGSVNKMIDVSEENLFRRERYVGQFHRSIPLPHPVSSEGVKASYKNGVLEVRMIKSRRENRKQIDVDFY